MTDITESQAYEALRIAQINSTRGAMASSASLAADDAAKCFNRGLFGYAFNRALDSLAYSCCVGSAEYERARQGLPRYVERVAS